MTVMDNETKKAAEAGIIAHNWMYSFMPNSLEGPYNFPIYLVGFCKQCRRSFSEPVKVGVSYKETEMIVPRYGCRPVED